MGSSIASLPRWLAGDRIFCPPVSSIEPAWLRQAHNQRIIAPYRAAASRRRRRPRVGHRAVSRLHGSHVDEEMFARRSPTPEQGHVAPSALEDFSKHCYRKRESVRPVEEIEGIGRWACFRLATSIRQCPLASLASPAPTATEGNDNQLPSHTLGKGLQRERSLFGLDKYNGD